MNRTLLAIIIAITLLPAALAANPGHSASSVSAGTFESGNYIFPAQLTVTGNYIVDTNTLYVDSSANEVGIGTSSPSTRLHVSGGGFLVSGSTGTTPTSGSGTRLMWVPSTGAFRAGQVGISSSGTEWDAANIGTLSTALGGDVISSGYASIAAGSGSNASGTTAIALGLNNNASGYAAVAIGDRSIASANYAIAYGTETTASGQVSLATGDRTTASGDNSYAQGLLTTASGESSIAMGERITASATNTFAIGLDGTPRTASQASSFVVMGGNSGFGTLTPSEILSVNGRIYLDTSTAPGTTTNRLYNVGGSLYWDGTELTGGTAGTFDYWRADTDDVSPFTVNNNSLITFAGGSGITTTDDGSTITFNAADSSATNELNTFTADSGGTTTGLAITLSGGSGISTARSADTITITATDTSATNELQNLWETITADTGSTSANSQTDSLAINGGVGISTSITGDAISVAVDDNYLSNTGDTASGDYNFDSNTLFVDASADSVGIGTNSPAAKLEVDGGVRLNTATSKPTCSSSQRGTMWYEQRTTGNDDILYTCMKNSGDTYAWVIVARGG